MAVNFTHTEGLQNLMLACYLKRPAKFLKYGSLLDPVYFQGSVATTVARVAFKHQVEFGAYPGWEVLENLVAEELKKRDDDPQVGIDYVAQLRDMDCSDVDYVVTQVIDHARYQAVVNAIKQTVTNIKENEPLDGSVVKLFEDAIGVGRDLEDNGYLYHVDAQRVIDKYAAVDYGVATGFPLLDQIWKRGWCPGWLIVPLAPPKRRKSTFIATLALNMINPRIGADVLYYPLEMSAEQTIKRMHQSHTNMGEDKIWEDLEHFRDQVDVAIQRKVAGKMVVKSYPSKTATIADIKAHAKSMIALHNMKPKAIFIDYAETVKPSDTKLSEHQQQANVYVEARAMGEELGCCVIMPDRCTKEAVGLAVPDMKSFQGAFQKAGVVDIAIGLCATDDQYNKGEIRYFIFLNRHGMAYQHMKGRVDSEIMKMTIDEEIEYDPEELSSDKRPRRKDSRGLSNKRPDLGSDSDGLDDLLQE